MQLRTRRVFMLQVVTGTAALAAGNLAQAQDRLSEDDPYARSMGFKFDTNKVDKARYPRHDPSQNCSNCQLFGGKPGDEWGPCSFFGDRLVKPTGWCRNYKPVKKG